ncbi:hypothetical protein F5Y16DRAFT_425185 [Xylariaceae sp. FL0255]|nr:hypothetical protein F5Y16DRAFT_425185 [Xylariaceae sp. FL0255]
MATHNTYLTYKKDTQYLVYWLIMLDGLCTAITTSNGIINRLPATDPDASGDIKVSSQATVAELLSLSQLIAKHVKNPADDDKDINEVLFSNQFASLSLGSSRQGNLQEDDESSANEDGSDQDAGSVIKPQKPSQKKAKGKGKKNRRNKKPKKRPSSTAKDSGLEDIPIESYRIIEDDGGLGTDYLIAVYSLATEWSQLRGYVQDLWYDVAHRGLNSAIAGTMSNVAIAMMKQSESAIFVAFPGYDSYEVVVNTITKGDPEGAQGRLTGRVVFMNSEGTEIESAEEIKIDTKEQFMLNTYQDLLDFVLDYQHTRSGKPAKAMIAQIRGWDPYHELRRATKDQRIKWRRSYTIKWLYGLFNVFSSVVVQQNKLEGKRHVYERVDWSTKGPWKHHRRIFGLNEFAGVITSLAMQRPGTDIRKMVLPSHVLQLQCIVDSFSVCRGWSNNALRGHVLTGPPRNFTSRRDIDLFLDRQGERLGKGFLTAVFMLRQIFGKKMEASCDPLLYERKQFLLDCIKVEFTDFLGESRYKHGLDGIPPSQFSETNSNGLWEYSPFLCGVGLMEGLELAYSHAMYLWEYNPEPMLVIHLHNMLVQKGFLEEPVGLYETLAALHRFDFFTDGKPPTSNFRSALAGVTSQTSSRFLHTNYHHFFKKKTMLIVYRQGKWNYERIPEDSIPVDSLLAKVRVLQSTPYIYIGLDKPPYEGKLADRMRAAGIDVESAKFKLSIILQNVQRDIPQTVKDYISQERGSSWDPYSSRDGNTAKIGLSKLRDTNPLATLELLKWDIAIDICAETEPYSAVNYMFVTVMFMMYFLALERELDKLRYPLYVDIYEGKQGDKSSCSEKRFRLVSTALAGSDEELLRAMARLFKESNSSIMRYTYWDALLDKQQFLKLMSGSGGYAGAPDAQPSCAVM